MLKAAAANRAELPGKIFRWQRDHRMSKEESFARHRRVVAVRSIESGSVALCSERKYRVPAQRN